SRAKLTKKIERIQDQGKEKERIQSQDNKENWTRARAKKKLEGT
ncbi:7962_t:CDS:1, partial [Dentiscutata heterogama]